MILQGHVKIKGRLVTEPELPIPSLSEPHGEAKKEQHTS